MSLHISPDLDLPLDAITETFAILAKPPEVQIAWAAGIFEGEGCISHDRQARGTRRELKVVMTDRDVIETLRAVTGVGRTGLRRPAIPPRKATWHWIVSNWTEVDSTLRAFLPYLHSRRRAKALELLADPAGRQGTVCFQGHPLRGEDADVYIKAGRSPRCAVCARERARRNRASS